jgi:hypothetical protein
MELQFIVCRKLDLCPRCAKANTWRHGVTSVSQQYLGGRRLWRWVVVVARVWRGEGDCTGEGGKREVESFQLLLS